MEPFKVTTTLDATDWQALLVACRKRVDDLHSRRSPAERFWPLVQWLVSIGILIALVTARPPLVDLESFVIALVLIAGNVWISAVRQRRLFAPAKDGAFLGATTFEFDAAGITVWKTNSSGRIAWALIKDVTHTQSHVFLWVDNMTAYCIRGADLPPPMTAQGASERIRGFIATSSPGAVAATMPTTAEIASVGASSDAPAVAAASAAPSPWQELAALARVAVTRTADPTHLRGSDVTVAILISLGALIWIAVDRIEHLGNDEVRFLWWGVPALAQNLVWGLSLAWVLARTSRPRVPFQTALLFVLAIGPVAYALWALATSLPEVGRLVVVALGAGFVTRWLMRGMAVVSGETQRRAVLVAALVAGGILWFSTNWFFGPGLWYSDDGQEQNLESVSQREELSFGQPLRIDADIANMISPPPDAPAFWFVGFAGYGDQRVFAEEIGKAAVVVREKFGTRDRQLLLVNDRRDREKYAYATAPALRHALARIGKRMNLEEDVLFLALSSHGSDDATLSVSNEFEYYESLSAEALRKALDDSGIRWRVIVISACHAGSFIPQLADERTIVLTAAAAEKTSFGCSDDRELTYFGEAFYRDALPKAASVREAFEMARDSIATRERAEKRETSDPQGSFGSLIEAKLAEIEQ